MGARDTGAATVSATILHLVSLRDSSSTCTRMRFTFSLQRVNGNLPKGATPVDFAFEIHSQAGTHCVGAKVNGRIVPLNTKLNSGDQIEIITSSNQNVNPESVKIRRIAESKISYQTLVERGGEKESG